MAKTKTDIAKLVADLPEIYQPIYGHPDLSATVSRVCEDRLDHLSAIYNSLKNVLNRDLRVLDLGCAQGFFSFHLAELGAEVDGVDFLDKNIAVCNSLREEHPDKVLNFSVGCIEDVINSLHQGKYDLVLGLSVFHHLIHEHGIDYVKNLFSILSRTVPAAVFELALHNEPLYWAVSQPNDPTALLKDYAFFMRVADITNHLSLIKRPLYFASNQLWFLGQQSGFFDEYQTDSHLYARGTHKGTRTYYFDKNYIVKVFQLGISDRSEINQTEYANEIFFLKTPGVNFKTPEIYGYGREANTLWIVRERIPGKLLCDCFDDPTIKPEPIIDEILSKLIELENVSLYHNDIRSWNVILEEDGRAHLIDYGAISSKKDDCVWPHNIYISFFIFIYEVLHKKVQVPEPFRPSWINPDRFPEPYSCALWLFLSLPQEQWSFNQIKQCLKKGRAEKLPARQLSPRGVGVLIETLEDATNLFRVHVGHQNKHITWLQGEWDASKAALEQQQQHGKWLQSEWDAAKAALEQQQQHGQWLQGEWDAAQGKINELNHSSHHWWMVAETRQQQIDALLDSTSWRITWPLRQLKRAIKWIVLLPVRFTKALLRPFLTVAIKIALKRQGLREKLSRRLQKWPKLHAHLKQFAWHRGLIVDGPVTGLSLVNDWGSTREGLSVSPAMSKDEQLISQLDSHLVQNSKILEPVVPTENQIDTFMKRIYSEIDSRKADGD